MKRTNLLFTRFALVVSLLALGVVNIFTQVGSSGSGREAVGGGGPSNPASTVKPRVRPVPKRTTPKKIVVPRKTAAQYVAEGEAFYKQKDYDSALVAYQNAVRLNPRLSGGWYWVSWLHNEFQEYSQALPAAEKAIALDSRYAYAYVEKGYALRNLKRPSEAISAFQQSVNLKSDYSTGYYELGRTLCDSGRYQEASTNLSQAVSLDPKNAEAYEYLGIAQRRLGQNSQAISSLNRSIQLDAADSGAYMALGDVYYYGTKEYLKAVNAYLKGLQYDDDNDVAMLNVGFSYNELQNYSEALRWLNKASGMKPSAAIYSEIGYSNFKLNNSNAAIEAYQRALQMNRSSATAEFGLGDVYYDILKDYKLAAEHYQKGVIISPDNANALYRLGFAYNDIGLYRDAIVPLNRARQLRPEWQGVPTELGYAYLQLKQYDNAIAVLKQAINLNRDSAPAHLYLGQAYVYTNNERGARSELSELKRLKSDKYAKQLSDLINGP